MNYVAKRFKSSYVHNCLIINDSKCFIKIIISLSSIHIFLESKMNVCVFVNNVVNNLPQNINSKIKYSKFVQLPAFCFEKSIIGFSMYIRVAQNAPFSVKHSMTGGKRKLE